MVSVMYCKYDLTSYRLLMFMLPLLRVYALQGSRGEMGKSGLPGIKGDMVRFHYVAPCGRSLI